MRGSRLLALAVLVAPALLACGGAEGGDGAVPASTQAADSPFSVTVYSKENFGGASKTFTNGSLDLSDLRKIKFDTGTIPTPYGALAKSIQSIRFSGRAWAVLFEEPNFKGKAVYVGWDQEWVGSLNNPQQPEGPASFNNKAMSMVIFVRGDRDLPSKKVNIVARGVRASSGGGTDNPDERKLFVCADGTSASSSYGWPLIANREVVGDVNGDWGSWETFDMYGVGYGAPAGTFFALRAAWKPGNRWSTPTQKYVVAEWQAGWTAPLYANRDEIGPWEVFRITDPIRSGGNWDKVRFTSITKNTQTYRATVNVQTKSPLSGSDVTGTSLGETNEFWIQDVTSTRQGVPLLIHPYTADPSAHVFNGRIYVYPSHDPDLWAGPPWFLMTDYHVFSMQSPGSQLLDHGVVMRVGEGAAAWAKDKMWAPDAAYSQATGKYYLYFPARAGDDTFHIGVGESATPEGPFTRTALAGYIPGTFSVDQAVLDNEDGRFFMYFGGIGDGQLQCWHPDGNAEWGWTFGECDRTVMGPMVALMDKDMIHLAKGQKPREIRIYTSDGKRAIGQDEEFKEMRYFEAPFVNKVNGKYYLSYSTGESGNLWVAWATDPYGDRQEDGNYGFRLLEEGNILPGGPDRCGWTTHHSIVRFEGKWYLFYHDAQLAPYPLGSECKYDISQFDKRSMMYKEIAFPPAR